MKKQVLVMLAALFAALVILPVGAYAADAYAILYEDGTLVFQNGDASDGRPVKATYEVDLNAVYTQESLAPWHEERESVLVADFADKISPTSTARWFYECSNLRRIDNIRNLDTANVTNMESMFRLCSALAELDLSYFDTANVTNMSHMFAYCRSLKELDLSHFDAFRVTNMAFMFYDCQGLTTLDVSCLNTVNVTDMSGMFAYCRNLTTLDLSHFDTSHVMMMDSMFFQSPNLKTIYVSDKFRITTTARKSSNVPFGGCDALVGGNGTKYDGSRSGPLYARIDTPSAPGYFTDISAKPVAYEITAAAPDTDAGTLSVTLTNPDAATLAVSYFDANGKFVSAEFQDAQVDAGTVALALSADAKTARVMLLDSDFRPLCAAYGAQALK